jgi:hypothetical protein
MVLDSVKNTKYLAYWFDIISILFEVSLPYYDSSDHVICKSVHRRHAQQTGSDIQSGKCGGKEQ